MPIVNTIWWDLTVVLCKPSEPSHQLLPHLHMAGSLETITSWIDSKGLEACVMRHRTELPRVSDALYVDVIDPAGRHRAEIKEFSRRLIT